MARSMLAALALLVGLGGPALAEDGLPSREVEADLDGDGAAEVYRLHYDGPYAPEPSYEADLTVEIGGLRRRVEGIAWSGGYHAALPELELAPDGSVLVRSLNDAYGRERWYLTLAVAHREGDWRVVSVRYSWRDTLDLEAWGRCEVDLLSGRGTVTTPAGERPVAAPFPAPPLWDWPEVDFNPYEVCGL